MARIDLNVNGKAQTIDADPDMPLLYALRNEFSLNNPHFGCGLAQCGACTVHVEGLRRGAGAAMRLLHQRLDDDRGSVPHSKQETN